jgi:hypothetical protein
LCLGGGGGGGGGSQRWLRHLTACKVLQSGEGQDGIYGGVRWKWHQFLKRGAENTLLSLFCAARCSAHRNGCFMVKFTCFKSKKYSSLSMLQVSGHHTLKLSQTTSEAALWRGPCLSSLWRDFKWNPTNVPLLLPRFCGTSFPFPSALRDDSSPQLQTEGLLFSTLRAQKG